MIHFDIRYCEEIPSTSTLLREEAGKGAAEGLVITTEFQTDGRGKPGRKWESPRGKNLLFSVLFRPEVRVNVAPMITQIACRSVAAVLTEKYGMSPAFKRPNDLLINGKKICGVLVETSSVADRLEAVIIGIGLNVNASGPELFPGSTSIREETGQETDRSELLNQILFQLAKDMEGLA
jgi:BirA family biotin operon repressor/biotin-[acetyl-CoA-carboxylase] ligase